MADQFDSLIWSLTMPLTRPESRPMSSRRVRPLLLLALLLAATFAIPASGQSGAPGEVTIDAGLRAKTIQQIGDLLKAKYVFPEVAGKCAEHLQAQLAAGAYDQMATAMPFADALTRDLQSVSHDKHLRVNVRPPATPAETESLGDEREPTPQQRREMEARMKAQMRKGNFGFQKLEVLDGNVGYLDLRGFAPAELAGDAAVNAMAFLASTDAIIIDLRNNGGGSPSMIQLISTYFFDEPTLLNTMYWREGDRTDQFWTLPHVPGERMPDTPLYVLTSGRTFSGAEEFSYNMKNLKRGTIIGETTGGGAHPGGREPVNEVFGIFIPVGRAINPISKTNWEGVGVEPDVSVPAGEALTLAHAKAVETLLANATEPNDKALLEWAKTGLEASMHPATPTAAELAALTGTYGERRVWIEDGVLKYRRGELPARALVPMTKGLFKLEGVMYFRVRFESDASGKVVRLVGMYDDGRVEPMERSGD